MSKIIIQIDSPETIEQLNSEIQEKANNPEVAIQKLIRYLRGSLYGENNGISLQITTRDQEVGASNAYCIRNAIERSTAASALVDVSITGSGENVQVEQSTINLSGGADAVKAQRIIQDITYEAVTAGAAGNSITIEYVDSGSGGLSVSEVGDEITVDFGGDTPDATTVAALPFTLVNATVSGTGSNIQTAPVTKDNLSGGADAIKASIVVQDITFQAKTAGASGNNISISYVDGGILGNETVTVVGSAITVELQKTIKTSGTNSLQNTHSI